MINNKNHQTKGFGTMLKDLNYLKQDILTFTTEDKKIKEKMGKVIEKLQKVQQNPEDITIKYYKALLEIKGNKPKVITISKEKWGIDMKAYSPSLKYINEKGENVATFITRHEENTLKARYVGFNENLLKNINIMKENGFKVELINVNPNTFELTETNEENMKNYIERSRAMEQELIKIKRKYYKLYKKETTKGEK